MPPGDRDPGLSATQELQNEKCSLIFVQDHIDTTTHQGQLFYTMQLAFAECERRMIGARVSEGIRRRIRQGGRWGKGARKDINVGLAAELLKIRGSLSAVARELGVPRNTLREHLER